MRRIGVVGLVLGALLVGVFAGAGVSAPGSAAAVTTYRVVAATHTSSASKDDPPFYTGSSTSRWKLAPPSKKAPNIVTVTLSPIALGGGTVNVRGVFKADAKTPDHPPCSLAAPTGTTEYPLAAPGPFELAITPDPKSSSRVLVSYGVWVNLFASLSNGYFGTECSTRVSGQPDLDRLTVKSVPKSLFRQKVVVIRYTGATNEEGIVYRWSTTLTLKRVKLS
jgi:hypothetical protein